MSGKFNIALDSGRASRGLNFGAENKLGKTVLNVGS
jgi:hypothetical protein